MYHERAHAGDTPEFWEENWANSQFEQAVKFCSVDPLRPLFEKYLKPGAVMLEGGCGMGQYVAYYAAKGFRVIGLDFAERALANLSARQPALELKKGDVSDLPFPDETFDLYFSNGVVEHFEGGAEKSLLEARRVIKPEGTLMLSVPYQSPLRHFLQPLKKNWKKIKGPAQEASEKSFFQYAYTRTEFTRMLDDAGLKVVETKGYSILWGIYDIPFFSKEEFPVSSAPAAEPGPVDVEPLLRSAPSSVFKRLVVSEDASVPVLGLGVRFLRWFASNMMMYVCIRK